MMVDNYCTTREAAEILGVSLRTAQQWVEKGYLQAWKTSGGHRRITRSSIEAALSERRRTTDSAPPAYALPILIVEDDAALLKLYRAQLSRWPFATAIYTAPNGFEGLVMVGECRPALLICDLRLPGVNGFQIVRWLSEIERYRDVRIVVVSGLPQGEIDAHGGVPGKVELMSKPIDFGRLQVIAHEVLTEHTTTAGEKPIPEEAAMRAHELAGGARA